MTEEASHRSAGPSRRSVLTWSMIAMTAVTSGASQPAHAAAAPASSRVASATSVEARATILRRRREMLTGAGAIERLGANASRLQAPISALHTRAHTLAETASPASPTALWSDLPLGGTAAAAVRLSHLAATIERLREIAIATQTPSGILTQDAHAIEMVRQGTRTILANHYHPGITAYDNWWEWEIGMPRDLVDIVALTSPLDDTGVLVTAAARHFAPSPLRRGSRATGSVETGANLADRALITCLRGAIDGREADLLAARDALSGGGTPSRSLFALVDVGDGFAVDGSMVQHTRIPYTGTYGVVALSGIAQMLALLLDTPWAVTDPEHLMAYELIDRTFDPYMFEGRMMDVVRGRAVSRERQRDYGSGFAAIVAALTLAESADAATGAGIRSRVKRWATECHGGPDWLSGEAGFAAAGAARIATLLDDVAVEPAVARDISVYHTAHERMVHRRPGWAFSVATSSTRIGRFEWGNAENSRGWYQGDGAVHLHMSNEPGHYSDGYWPTVDAHLLAGTTVTSVPRVRTFGSGTSSPRSSSTFNGGVFFDDFVSTGAALSGFVEQGPATLTGWTSWHAFDEEIVCLGSEISDSSGTEVVTVMENRGYPTGEVPTVRLNGNVPTTGMDAKSVSFRHWAAIDGHVGFVLLTPQEGAANVAHFMLRRRTGSWDDINRGGDTAGSTTAVSRDFATLRISHGVRPRSASYAYMVLPRADLATAAERHRIPGVTTRIEPGVGHGVTHASSGITSVQFFAPGTIGDVSATAPCSLAFRLDEGVAHVTVSNSNRSASLVTLTLPFASDEVDLPRVARVVSAAPLIVEVDVNGTLGRPLRFSARI